MSSNTTAEDKKKAAIAAVIADINLSIKLVDGKPPLPTSEEMSRKLDQGPLPEAFDSDELASLANIILVNSAMTDEDFKSFKEAKTKAVKTLNEKETALRSLNADLVEQVSQAEAALEAKKKQLHKVKYALHPAIPVDLGKDKHIENLRKKIQELDRYNTALNTDVNKLGVENGNLVKKMGVRDQDILDLTRRLEGTNSQMTGHDLTHEKLLADYNEMKDLVEHHNRKYEAAKDMVEHQKAEVDDIRANLRITQEQLKMTKKELKKVTTKPEPESKVIEALKQQVIDVESAHEVTKQELADLQHFVAISSIPAEAKKTATDNKSLRILNAELIKQLTEARAAIAANTPAASYEQLKSDHEKIKSDHEKTLADSAKLEAEVADLKRRAAPTRNPTRQVKAMQADMASRSRFIEELQTKIRGLENTVASEKKNFSEAQQTIKALQSQDAVMKEPIDVDALKAQIANLTSALADGPNEDAIKRLEEESTGLKAKIVAMQAEHDHQILVASQSYEKDTADLKAQIENMRSVQASASASSLTEDVAMKDPIEVDELKAEIGFLTDALADAWSADAVETLKSLKEESTRLKAKMVTMQAEHDHQIMAAMGDYDSETMGLQEKIDTLESSLASKAADAEKETAGHKAQIENLHKAQASASATATAKQVQETEWLHSQIDKLEYSVAKEAERFEDETAGLRAQIKQLQSAQASASETAKFEEETAGLKAQIKHLESAQASASAEATAKHAEDIKRLQAHIKEIESSQASKAADTEKETAGFKARITNFTIALTDTEASKKRAIESLEEESAGLKAKIAGTHREHDHQMVLAKKRHEDETAGLSVQIDELKVQINELKVSRASATAETEAQIKKLKASIAKHEARHNRAYDTTIADRRIIRDLESQVGSPQRAEDLRERIEMKAEIATLKRFIDETSEPQGATGTKPRPTTADAGVQTLVAQARKTTRTGALFEQLAASQVLILVILAFLIATTLAVAVALPAMRQQERWVFANDLTRRAAWKINSGHKGWIPGLVVGALADIQVGFFG